MSSKDYPSIRYLRQCFREENGRLFWLERPRRHFRDECVWKTWNKRWPGKEAGNRFKDGDGYYRWQVGLQSRTYTRYMIIWALHKGKWCSGLDHINRDPLDDRIENLRVATKSQNAANCRIPSNNTSGIKGVAYHKRTGKWQVQIKVRGQHISLGCYFDIEEARAARVKAAQEYFGEFACEE